jgi:hypothetical protein
MFIQTNPISGNPFLLDEGARTKPTRCLKIARVKSTASIERCVPNLVINKSLNICCTCSHENYSYVSHILPGSKPRLAALAAVANIPAYRHGEGFADRRLFSGVSLIVAFKYYKYRSVVFHGL